MDKMFEPNRLLDRLAVELKVRSEKQLAKKLGLGVDVIADVRRRKTPVTPTMLLQMQEVSGVPVETLRALMGDRRRRMRVTGLRRAPGTKTQPQPYDTHQAAMRNVSAAVRGKGAIDPSDAYGYRRRNHVQAAYVNAALELRDTVGAPVAADFLREEGIAEAVVERVLASPQAEEIT